MVIRATVVCVHNDSPLLVHQTFKDIGNFWSLPGGKVEEGETIFEAAIREAKEETGIKIKPKRLLYVSQRFINDKHIVHILVEATYESGNVGEGLSLTTQEVVESVSFVPINELESHGVLAVFANKVRSGFIDAGAYCESMQKLGL